MPIPDNSPLPGERWYSVQEIAAHLGVAVDTVYRWIDHRGLPAHRIGRIWKCKLAEVDAWVRAGGSAEVPGTAKSKRSGGPR
ncbi:MAG: helix-turn-helix domain-containing protein [Bryobacterales bacterium]|nr:helix-turn-helix domain-containing protein [Bryobacterales bacterium]